MPPRRASYKSVLLSAAYAFIGGILALYEALTTLNIPGNFPILFVFGIILISAGFLLIEYSRRTGYI